MINSLMSVQAYFVLRCFLAGVFLYSGAGKLMDIQGFAVVIGGYGILPDQLNLAAAVFLPVIEIFIASGLVWNIKGALSAYTVLLVIFMAVLAYGISMGLDVDCGCFAPGDPEGEAYHSLREALLRDALLLTLCGYLYWLRSFRGYQSRSLISLVAR